MEVPAHQIEIKGRRWRRTDPGIPEAFRNELVHELMDARRAVAAGQRASDPDAVAAARARVQDAKVALGERGPAWWEPMDEGGKRVRLRATMRSLLQGRDPESTICPSDAARAALGEGWRDDMPLARAVAAALHEDGIVEVRQRGQRVPDPHGVRGPMRLGRGAGFASGEPDDAA